MIEFVITAVLLNIFLSFMGRLITSYIPFLSNNPIVEYLNMNQRKLITSSVIVGFIIFATMNIKIKNLYKITWKI